MIHKKEVIVDNSHDRCRLDVAAAELCPDLSRKKIKSIIDQGGCYVSGKRVLMAKHEVCAGQKIMLVWRTEEPKKAQELTSHSLIIEENKDYLVIHKPATVPSQATLESVKGDIIELVAQQLSIPRETLFLVHRLDKDTSGLMIIGRNKKTQGYFETLFLERKITKQYTALCFGLSLKDEFDIDLALEKDATRNNMYIPHRRGKSAFTKIVTLKRYERMGVTLVHAFPKTGRTHQIRVHLAAFGLPLLGDRTYSNHILGHPAQGLATRHMLHASALQFKDPSGLLQNFTLPLPSDFQEALTKIENYERSV